ncbi:MAG: permease [Candidatus Roseilinea sp.]|nr:MAG: permease [Candidatus Roseilinea sp.]
MIDILGLGATAVDHLIYVPAYPPPNVKSYVLRSERQCGGLTATALVAASRLGARCAYAGMLGHDDASQFVAQTLRREGIDLSHLVTRDDAGPIRSTIIVGTDRGTRNIFPEHPAQCGAHPTLPSDAVIRSARVLFVDHVGVEGMIRAARIAREAGIPVVSDVERDLPGCRELLALVNHVVMSWEFAQTLTGADSPQEATRRLWASGRALVAVTCGEDGCFFSDDGQTVHHQPAFRVEVVDTTGCGDVFHGAYCAALAKGMSAAARIRFASAAAALKATQSGGQAGAPTLEQTLQFLGAQT